MTKKDYELIASAFRYAQTVGGTTNYVLNCMATLLARKLQHDNSRFDFERFIEACELGE